MEVKISEPLMGEVVSQRELCVMLCYCPTALPGEIDGTVRGKSISFVWRRVPFCSTMLSAIVPSSPAAGVTWRIGPTGSPLRLRYDLCKCYCYARSHTSLIADCPYAVR